MNQSVAKAPKNMRDNAMKNARKTLERKGNRLMLVFGILACILTIFSVVLIVDAFDVAFSFSQAVSVSVATMVLDAVIWVVCFFMAFPLCLGVIRGAVLMAGGRVLEFSQFFVFYGSWRMYLRALKLQLCILVYACPYIAVLFCKYLFLFAEEGMISPIFPWLSLLPLPAFLIVGFLSTSRVFPFAILALGDSQLPVEQAIYYATETTRGRILSVCAMRIRFVWRFLLSLLSIGVVTLIHVIPLMLLTYGEYTSELVDSAEF